MGLQLPRQRVETGRSLQSSELACWERNAEGLSEFRSDSSISIPIWRVTALIEFLNSPEGDPATVESLTGCNTCAGDEDNGCVKHDGGGGANERTDLAPEREVGVMKQKDWV